MNLKIFIRLNNEKKPTTLRKHTSLNLNCNKHQRESQFVAWFIAKLDHFLEDASRDGVIYLVQ